MSDERPVESTAGVVWALIGLVATVALLGYFLVLLSATLSH